MDTLKEHIGLKRLIGRSPSFAQATEKLPLFARSDASVLIVGDTGTGKELFARTLHYLSPRARGPFVAVNCGALPLELVENELFGHERAAFTGASSARPGLVEESDRGTLFLDEVDALPLMAQVKLLRFLQDGEVRRLGATSSRSVDARVIAASNARVQELVERGELRRDLYYRLNVLTLELPPLARRREDIPLLVDHFLREHTPPAGGPPKELGPRARAALLGHSWPGNVRELENVIQRALLLSGDRTTVSVRDLGLETPPGEPARAETFQEAKERVVSRFERDYAERMLAAHCGNISRAARAAQRSRRGFWGLLRKHGIDADRFR